MLATIRDNAPLRFLLAAPLGWLSLWLWQTGTLFAQTAATADAPAAAPVRSVVSRGHAHNDYLHERPLHEALERGFASIEADIFLRDGQLLLGHTHLDLRPERTLEGMYLKPLAEWINEHAGSVLKPRQPLVLLIDIKTDGVATWTALHQLLIDYREILSETQAGKFQPRAVTVIVSGNRAVEQIRTARPQLAGVDGRLSDLDSPLRADEMPLISDNWRKHFQWRGSGAMPAEEKKKLVGIVTKAHAAGRMVRFWATPESEAVWQELQSAGVDLIGTDRLEQLELFLERDAERSPRIDPH